MLVCVCNLVILLVAFWVDKCIVWALHLVLVLVVLVVDLVLVLVVDLVVVVVDCCNCCVAFINSLLFCIICGVAFHGIGVG